AIDDEGNITHNNAQLTKEAVEKLYDDRLKPNDIELLSCGTSSPDQILPSHAAMVHGFLKNGNTEINSPSGACCSGMNALKYGFLCGASGRSSQVVCTGSERTSSWTMSRTFQDVLIWLVASAENRFVAFYDGFLRWLLPDLGGGFLLERESD